MIRVKTQGRLGNQMFQYAFAYTQGQKYSILFFTGELDYKQRYYQLEKYFKLRVNEKILTRFAQVLYLFWFKHLNSHQEKTERGYQKTSEISPKFGKNIFWDGFFQSEEYFKPYEEKIKKLFTVQKKFKRLFDAKYKEVFSKNKVLVLHVRRTDYLDFGSENLGGKGLMLPMNYYEKCLVKIPNLQDYYVIVIGDDLEFAKKHFSNHPNFHVESNEQIIDFQIMQHANTLIISNSTFAWWGAYLNHKQAQVFAPQYWLGFKVQKEYPQGIMTDKFNWVMV